VNRSQIDWNAGSSPAQPLLRRAIGRARNLANKLSSNRPCKK